MDTVLRHKIWEVFIKGKNHPILASKITLPSSDGVQLHEEALLKRIIAEHIKDNETYITCSQCGCGLFYRAANSIQNRSAYLYHNTKFAHDILLTENCPFYHNTPSTLFSQIYNGEGEWHLSTKMSLSKILDNDPFVSPGTVETEKLIFSDDPKRNTWRRPDIQFTDKNGQKWAIELTRWWMSPLIVVQREEFFREENINLLWVFSPQCAEHNKTTYELIMYGSNIPREACSEASRPQCNAFVATERALKLSQEKGKLILDVEFPEYYYCKERQEIGANFQFHLASLEVLNTAPKLRLPFAVKTSTSLSDAKLKLHQHNRQRLAITITNIRKRNESHLALTAITDNDEHPINPFSGLEVIHTDYRFHSHLRDKCLKAKQHIDYLRMQNLRAARYKLISLLRRETSNIWTTRNYRDSESLRYAMLNTLDTPIFENYKLISNVNRYRNIITTQLAAIEARTQRAEQIWKTKNIINQLPHQVIKGTHSPQIAFDTLNRIKTKSQVAISSILLLRAIDRSTRKVEKITKEQEETSLRLKQEQYEREQALQRQAEQNKRRVSNEVHIFINQLNTTGFTEMPISSSYDEIKFRRLQHECNQQELHELRFNIEQAYSQAYTNLKDTYLLTHFPLTSSGWNANTNFTTELNKLFGWQRNVFYTKSVADKQGAMKKSWCAELLTYFIHTVLYELDELYQELHGEPHIDQVIQVKKYGGTHARRLTYILKMIINQGSLITSDDKAKANWLKKLVLQKSLVNR